MIPLTTFYGVQGVMSGREKGKQDDDNYKSEFVLAVIHGVHRTYHISAESDIEFTELLSSMTVKPLTMEC